MLKHVLLGVWLCAATAGSTVLTIGWISEHETDEDDFMEGLDYVKVRPINIPIIRDGRIEGYVVTQVVFTADARTLRSLSVPAESFVTNETFRQIYADESVTFNKIERTDLGALSESIRANVNRRLQADVIDEVMLERFDYVAAAEIVAQQKAAKQSDAPNR